MSDQGPVAAQPMGGPPPDPGYQPSVGPRAGFGRRLVAWFIDALLFAITGYIVGKLMGQETLTTNDGTVSYELTGGPFLLTSLVGLIYYVLLEGNKAGQTLGKKAMGIRVIDSTIGGPIGYGRAFVRWIGRVVSAIPLFLGYFWMIWDNNKQTWHDKFASAIVVPVDAYPVT